MNGIKYFLDTNALISFLQGNPNLSYLKNSSSRGISIISVLEFLSFSQIQETDEKIFYQAIKSINIFEVKFDNLQLIRIVADFRRNNKMKLPDAIIAGTAIINDAVLITNDKGFSKILSLKTEAF